MPALEAPIAPVIQLGPVLVIPAPERTAKLPAVASPGSVAASADAGQIRNTRATRLNEITELPIFFMPTVLLRTRNKFSKISEIVPAKAP